MNFIKKIFLDKADNEVHKQFVRFSKGRFANRAIARIKKGKKISIRTKPVSLSKSELINLYEKYKDIFLLLNLECGNCSLKCKQNLPKPGSGKQSEDEAEMKKVDFCKAVFEKDLSEEFIWEKKDFKEAEASHIFVIDELVVPKELENDYARARIEAKRKGKIIRELTIDGEKKIIEKGISV